MHTITILTLILTTIWTIPSEGLQPTLTIQTINNKNGYAIIKTEKKPIIDNYLKILHIFNTSEVEESVYNIKQAVNLMKTSKQNTLRTFIETEYNSLVSNIKAIAPHRRQKRGLINFMGKLSKYIYGTMDSDDADEIYEHLRNLDTNTKNVVVATNEQVQINNKLIKIAAEIKNHTNTQTETINKYLRNVQNMTNRIIKAEEDITQAFELYLIIQKLNRLIEKFTDVILLSRLNILAHDIFSREEAETFNITAETLPFIGTNVVIDDNLIVFVLKIPQFTKNSFYEALVVPFPNLQKEEINLPITKVILNNSEMYEYKEENIKKKNLKLIENNCIRKLLENNNMCKYKINKEESITQLDNYMIITKNLKQTRVKQNCTEQDLYLEGNNIITFHYCTIEINNIKYKNEHTIYVNTFIIPQVDLNTTKLFDNITLEKINFETVKNREIIEYVEFKQKIQNTIGTITIIIIIFLIIIIVITLIHKKNKKFSVTNIELKNYVDPFKKENV